MYREVAPVEIKEQAKNPVSGAPRGSGRTQAQGEPAASGNGEGKNRKITDALDAVIPDPLEWMMGDLMPFRLWMANVADPGTEPTWEVAHDPEEGTVTVTAESQMTDSMSVTVEVTSSVEQAPEAPSSTVSVTVTDPQTGRVTASPEVETVEGGHDDIPRVAIGEVVEAVVTASTDGSAEPEDAAAADEVIEHADEALETLPEASEPLRPVVGATHERSG